MMEEFRKLLLLSDRALFLVEFELWNCATKLSFRKRVSLVTGRRFRNNGYEWKKTLILKTGLNKTVFEPLYLKTVLSKLVLNIQF